MAGPIKLRQEWFPIRPYNPDTDAYDDISLRMIPPVHPAIRDRGLDLALVDSVIDDAITDTIYDPTGKDDEQVDFSDWGNMTDYENLSEWERRVRRSHGRHYLWYPKMPFAGTLYIETDRIIAGTGAELHIRDGPWPDKLAYRLPPAAERAYLLNGSGPGWVEKRLFKNPVMPFYKNLLLAINNAEARREND